MPLPDLTTDPAVKCLTTGRAERVSGQQLILLPLRAPIGRSRGRRYRVEFDTSPAVSRVVLSIAGQAALRPSSALPLVDGQLVPLRLQALPQRRTARVPKDLQRGLEEAGTSLGGVSDADVQHLVLMVTEAKDPAIRAERIRAAVDAARQMTGADE